MSKWRPAKNCIYVIPAIKGSIGPLKLICNRILPLRKSNGSHDQLIMLGNYIGDGKSSYDVLDFLIDIKIKNKEQVHLLKGTQESNLLKALALKEDQDYDYWLSYGGKKIAIEYLKRAKTGIGNPYLLPRIRLKDIIPDSHIDLLTNLSNSYVIKNNSDVYRFNGVKEEGVEGALAPKEKWIINIFGHNSKFDKPCLSNSELYLDAGAPKRLMVLELNSMEAFIAKPRKKSMIKCEIYES